MCSLRSQWALEWASWGGMCGFGESSGTAGRRSREGIVLKLTNPRGVGSVSVGPTAGHPFEPEGQVVAQPHKADGQVR